MVRSNCIRERKQVERRLKVELGSSPVTSLGVVLNISSALLYDDLEWFWTMDSLGHVEGREGQSLGDLRKVPVIGQVTVPPEPRIVHNAKSTTSIVSTPSESEIRTNLDVVYIVSILSHSSSKNHSLSVFRRNHWGIGRFCLAFLASFCLIRKVFCDG